MTIRLLLLLTVILLTAGIFAQDSTTPTNSRVEFPYIVLVGQVVDITPYSVTVENTEHETFVSNSKIRAMRASFNKQIDFRAHGFANAMKLVSVKDEHMRLNFFLDNIGQVFHQNLRTYMDFLPLLYMFRNNMTKLQVPKKLADQIKDKSMEFYLTAPYVKKIMSESWFAGVFKIHPESNKLVYHASSFFESYDDLMSDDFAREYHIPEIVRAGMTMTMIKTVVTGNESSRPAEGGGSKSDSDETGTPGGYNSSQDKGTNQGGVKRGNGQ